MGILNRLGARLCQSRSSEDGTAHLTRFATTLPKDETATRRIGIVGTACLFGFLAGAARAQVSVELNATQLSPDSALQVTVMAPPDEKGTATAEVKNLSDRPVTAYALRWTAGRASNVVTYDFFASLGMESLFHSGKGVGALQPGASREAQGETGGIDVDIAINVTPAAVVFGDATAIGDSATIGKIFASRRAEATALNTLFVAASNLDPSNAAKFFEDLGRVTLPAGSLADEMRRNFQSTPATTSAAERPDSFLSLLRARCATAKLNSRRVQ